MTKPRADDGGLDSSGVLLLKHVLSASGITDLAEVTVIRHTAKPDGLRDVWAASPEEVAAYTREQSPKFQVFPKHPRHTWLVFMEDGSHHGVHRSRFYGAYENEGEEPSRPGSPNRFFNIRPTPLLALMKHRLVTEWTGPRIFHRRGELAGEFKVLEIADPQVIPFVGYDKLRLTYQQLQSIVDDPHYSRWHSALSAVKGIYLISDTTNGKQYVGKADGAGGVLGRWEAYAHNGHGWNKELVALPKDQCQQFMFSLLRVFGPEALKSQVDEAEIHYKEALLSRRKNGGYNAN